MTANVRVIVLLFLAILVVLMWIAAFASKAQEKALAGVVPLDPVSFETLTLVTAGTGGTFENHWRRGPVLAIGIDEDLVLLDAGRSTTEALRAASIPAEQARVVLLTSLAPENVLGLDEVWLDAWLRNPAEPLRIFGPEGTAAFVTGMQAAFTAQADVVARSWEPALLGGEIEVREVAGGESFEVGALTVSAHAIGGGMLPSLAWRVDARERTITVAVSGSDAEAITEAARGSHVLVTGGLYGASLDQARGADVPGFDAIEREAAAHVRLEDVGGIAQAAGVHGVVLTRLRPPPVFEWQFERLVNETFRRGPVIVAEDGETVIP